MSDSPHEVRGWQLLVSSLLVLLLASCSGRRPAEVYVYEPETTEEAPIDSVNAASIQVVAASAATTTARILNYNDQQFVEPASSFDVQHTALDLAFDFPGERVIGTATHRLVATAQLLTHIQLDAKDMEIRDVSIKRPGQEFESIAFQYNNADLVISLQPGIGKTVALEVKVDYVAHPMRNGQKMGMVFVDGQGDDPSVPTQVWTLGQPEDNQFWFPGWDYPNDRMTFDLALTVPQQFSTIANGDLVEQRALADNMRRDRWVLNKPHVSYLTGFAAGEFSAVVENYQRADGTSVPLAYLVEPQHAENANLIFGETPDMMRFFERNLQVKYPWSNYKQVTVREFTARGMENTTATIMYDKLQHDARAHLDYTGRDLITHELAHQWFGNMVSSRNWANLALNEGFATYAERLYMEHADGLAVGQAHTIWDREAYFGQAQTLMRPIIWHGYGNPYDMYDRHTYEKAALVLHQLRYELGNDVWWRGVRQYLTANAYKEVTIDALQRAMEQASGKGLGGFFQQWYRRPGHPVLNVSHRFDASRGVYEIDVAQVQDSARVGLFAFDVDIEVNVPNAAPWVSRYRVATQDTTFRFAIAGDISFVRFDRGDWLPAEINVKKSIVEWQNQARYDDEPAGRYDAVVALADQPENANVRNVLLHVLQSDDAAFVREAAAAALDMYGKDEVVRPFLLKAVTGDRESGVRKQALATLAQTNDEQLKQALASAINDNSYVVTAEAIRIYADVEPLQAVQEMRPLFDVVSWDNTVETAMIDAYGRINAIEGIPYLQARMASENRESIQIAAIEALSGIAQYNPDARGSIAQYIVGKVNSPSEPVRFAIVQALEPIFDDYVVTALNRHLQGESSGRIRPIIQRMVTSGN
ncbi:MAG: M1 family aminopeptidase [Bacteroidota bacterium]